MTPEEKARVKIDQWFAEAGWRVVDRSKAILKQIISCLSMGKLSVCLKRNAKKWMCQAMW